MYIYIYIYSFSPPVSAAATLLWYMGEAARLWRSSQYQLKFRMPKPWLICYQMFRIMFWCEGCLVNIRRRIHIVSTEMFLVHTLSSPGHL